MSATGAFDPSRFRDGGLYSGLPLGDVLAEAGAGPKLGLFIVDLRTGRIAGLLLVDGPMYELIDVIALAAVPGSASTAMRSRTW